MTIKLRFFISNILTALIPLAVPLAIWISIPMLHVLLYERIGMPPESMLFESTAEMKDNAPFFFNAWVCPVIPGCNRD
jgi:hypothetical protein